MLGLKLIHVSKRGHWLQQRFSLPFIVCPSSYGPKNIVLWWNKMTLWPQIIPAFTHRRRYVSIPFMPKGSMWSINKPMSSDRAQTLRFGYGLSNIAHTRFKICYSYQQPLQRQACFCLSSLTPHGFPGTIYHSYKRLLVTTRFIFFRFSSHFIDGWCSFNHLMLDCLSGTCDDLSFNEMTLGNAVNRWGRNHNTAY